MMEKWWREVEGQREERGKEEEGKNSGMGR